jgi:hypothetical protein
MQDLNKVIAEKDAEISRLRLVLQRIGRWGSPMIRGYIDAALVGRQAGGRDPLADDQVGENCELEAQGMSDIVERLQRKVFRGPTMEAVHTKTLEWEAADTITRLRADIISYKIGNKDLQDHCTEITSLIAEADQNATDLEEYRLDVERLRAALRECEAELNACYRSLYPGDHPYSQKELAKARASNPATVALSGCKHE